MEAIKLNNDAKTSLLVTNPLLRLPSETAEKAREFGVIERKLRKFSGPLDLLSTILLAVSPNTSLREAIAWRGIRTETSISHVALYKLLIKASPWLEWIIGALVKERLNDLSCLGGRPVQAVDATTVYHMNTKELMRIHTKFSTSGHTVSSFELSDQYKGESLRNFQFQRGEIVLADRAYCRFAGLAHTIHQGADVVVRLLSNMKMHTPEGKEIQWETIAKKCRKPGESIECEAYLHSSRSKQILKGRLIIFRVSEKTAQKEFIYRQEQAAKTNNGFSPRVQTACSYILLWTSLEKSEYSTEQILEIYRLRWQIELLFKRMKTLHKLELLPRKNPQAVKSFVLAKLLAIMLTEDLVQMAGDLFIQEGEERLCS